MIKAVLFDIYGTLLSTGTGSVCAAQAILDKRGVRMSAAKFYARWKQIHRMHLSQGSFPFLSEEEIYYLDIRMLYDEYKIGTPENADEDVHFMLKTQGTRTPFPDTIPALSAISLKKIAASTNDHAPLLKDLERAGIVLDGVHSSQSLRVYKPEPLFYQRILEAEGLLPEECIFVGDTLLDDVYGPWRVSIAAVWLNRKKVTPDIAALPNAKDIRFAEIHSLLELPAILNCGHNAFHGQCADSTS